MTRETRYRQSLCERCDLFEHCGHSGTACLNYLRTASGNGGRPLDHPRFWDPRYPVAMESRQRDVWQEWILAKQEIINGRCG